MLPAIKWTAVIVGSMIAGSVVTLVVLYLWLVG
jgi:hypothetical protein